MSAWQGKYVIGLTGNIATGKSVVRKILEHMGAYGIDADGLSHRAIAKGAPGYKPIVDIFGKWILGPDQQIDRSRLGKIAFADPNAMEQLEAIIHPLVRQAVDILIKRASQEIIILEAIKLIEGPLAKTCDTIWVTASTEENQLSRLKRKRGLTTEEARSRISAQAPQEEKIKAANIVINNNGSFEELWEQVLKAWRQTTSQEEEIPAVVVSKVSRGTIKIQRARPRQADQIAHFINRTSQGKRKLTQSDIMEAFGEKAYLLLTIDDGLSGLVGWQVENLVARVTDFHFDPATPLKEVLPTLLGEVEKACKELQSEISLLFLPPQLAKAENFWRTLGYRPFAPERLVIRAWQEAAIESQIPGTIMLFKQLRQDRVLRPI